MKIKFNLFAIKIKSIVKFLNIMSAIFNFCSYTCRAFSWLLVNLKRTSHFFNSSYPWLIAWYKRGRDSFLFRWILFKWQCRSSLAGFDRFYYLFAGKFKDKFT